MDAPKARKPTIKSVAIEAGVSIATVSAVVNGASWVPEGTRLRVEAAVTRLGYRPNRLARGLKTNQSYTVGVIVSDITNPFFTEIVRSLGLTLNRLDRNLVLCDSDHQFELGRKNFLMLLEKQVDGIVLIGDTVKDELLAEHIAATGSAPVIAIERDYDLPDVSRFLVDARRGAREATRHLLEQGYERLAMISGPSEGPGSTTFSRTETIEGFTSELLARGFDVDPKMIVAGNYRYDGGREAMEILLGRTHAPDAVFVDNDLMALGAMQVAREHGLHIPKDLGIVGFDDIPGAALASIPLTTLSVPRAEIGEAIANHLLDRIADPETCPPVRRFFKTRLVVRMSSTRLRDQRSKSQTSMMKQE